MTSRSLLLLILATALAACGKPVSATSVARRCVPLDLHSVLVEPGTLEIERYLQLRPSPGANWSITGCAAEFLPREVAGVGEPQFTLALDCEKRALINIPGPFDGRAFNAVTLELELERKCEFTVNFVADGELLPVQGRATSRQVKGRQSLHFEFPTLFRTDEHITRLRLASLDRVPGLLIHSVDLLRKPLSLILPSPEAGPGLILVAGENRRGVGLSSGHALRSQLKVKPGAELRFSFAAPGEVPGAESVAALQLTVTGSGGQRASTRFDPTGNREVHWNDARFALDEFVGQDVELVFEVTGAPGAIWALAEAGVLEGQAEPMRVLLITSDTHRADHLGTAQLGVDVRTPTLDALAERGITFEDCYASTNITNPSHISLMTATHPRDTGILSNNEPVARVAGTLAEAFRSAGFATFASVSVNHLGPGTSGLGQGFDRVSEPRLKRIRGGGESLNRMLPWIEASPDVPLFLWLHVYDAHTPYDPPRDVLTSYYPDPKQAFDPEAPVPEGVPAHVYDGMFPGLKDLEYPKALYAGEITSLDEQLARILTSPLLEDAVVAFTSDHGESLGAHGVFYAHADLYPDSLHIPLILAFPGANEGERLQAPVQLLDLGRTLLDLAGLYGTHFPGSNLLDLASVPARDRTPRFAIGAGFQTASITLDGWHLIMALTIVNGRHRAEVRPLHQVSLYNLGRDPKTSRDLLESEFERARVLREQLLDWLAETEDRGWRGGRVTDEETLRALEALGYVASTEDNSLLPIPYDTSCTCTWCERFGSRHQ